MKKITLLTMLFCSVVITSRAQTTSLSKADESAVTVSTQNDLALVGTTVTSSSDQKSQLNNSDVAKTKDLKSTKQQKKKPTSAFSERPWYYIGAGAFIVLVVVIYVATNGQGYSSR